MQNALQNEASVALLNSQTGAFVLWICCGSLNGLAAIFTILCIILWKPLHTDTQFLAANLALSEIGLSLCVVGPAIYHLRNIYFGYSEVMSENACFSQVFGQYLFMLLIPVFNGVLCLERFLATVFPFYYKRRHRCYVYFITFSIWTICPWITFSLYAGFTDNLLVVECIGRFISTAKARVLYLALEMTVSVLSFTLYILLILILRLEIKKAMTKGQSFIEISQRMRNKVTRSVALTALAHLVTYTGSIICAIIVANFTSNSSILGPYFSAFHVFGGILTLPVYLICQQNFRDAFRYMFQKSCQTTMKEAAEFEVNLHKPNGNTQCTNFNDIKEST